MEIKLVKQIGGTDYNVIVNNEEQSYTIMSNGNSNYWCDDINLEHTPTIGGVKNAIYWYTVKQELMRQTHIYADREYICQQLNTYI